jgi:hypothetical protein
MALEGQGIVSTKHGQGGDGRLIGVQVLRGR